MDKIESRLNELAITNNDVHSIDTKWGWPLKDLYRNALSFYKEKSGKAVQFTYEDNLKLVAFSQQALYGPVTDSLPPIGAFDVIGRDRRLAWQNLGNINKSQSMDGFIDLLDRLCPTFRPYIEAIKKDIEEKERLAQEAERHRQDQLTLERQQEMDRKLLEEQKNRDEMQKRKLQDALNQQTYLQFRAYAEKQYPGNPEQQGILILQLQNEHYHQYMQQLHAQIATEKNEKLDVADEQNDGIIASIGNSGGPMMMVASNHSGGLSTKENNQYENDDKEVYDSDNESTDGFPPISPANMWTKLDIEQFKAEVASGKGEGIIKVGHGDIVTVRVPTHEGGSCLYWEFATDNYDIGFGIYFEWGKPSSSEVSVQVCDSDDDDDEEDDEAEVQPTNDLESGANGNDGPPSPVTRFRPPISSVIPVYRRECHSEVYVGSHNYPGEGVYLLKFDNSYSLWRSKTLYYRVFYTR